MNHWANQVAEFVRRARKSLQGVKVLKAWLGDGGEPVHPAQANTRGFACVGCPENKEVQWSDFIKSGIAEIILDAERLRHDSNFQTINDEELGQCRICLCYLKLKVWCPLDYIEKETTEEDLRAFPARCWIRKEIEEHERTQTIQ